MADGAVQLERLVRRLEESGEFRAEWREAFLAVPRHLFIPDVVWRSDPDGSRCLVPLRRADDPVTWLKRAYARRAVVTQVDDGEPAGGRGRKVTSSASDPRVVGLMLAALDAQPGDRVLEIGTGTGYNAALLAQRLGAEHVTTIEVDTSIADHARAALKAAGFASVSVVTGHGREGCPGRAPFDRVISTAAQETWAARCTEITIMSSSRWTEAARVVARCGAEPPAFGFSGLLCSVRVRSA